jgi:hypothetical protein
MSLHNAEELDDDLGARPDHNLTFTGLLGVVDTLESIVKNRDSHHFGRGLIFGDSQIVEIEMRYLPSR